MSTTPITSHALPPPDLVEVQYDKDSTPTELIEPSVIHKTWNEFHKESLQKQKTEEQEDFFIPHKWKKRMDRKIIFIDETGLFDGRFERLKPYFKGISFEDICCFSLSDFVNAASTYDKLLMQVFWINHLYLSKLK